MKYVLDRLILHDREGEGRVIFSVPWFRGERFGLLLFGNWFYIGTFEVKDA